MKEEYQRIQKKLESSFGKKIVNEFIKGMGAKNIKDLLDSEVFDEVFPSFNVETHGYSEAEAMKSALYALKVLRNQESQRAY